MSPIDLNECVPNPCLNGGNCVDRVRNYSCNCISLLDNDAYFTGRNCSIRECAGHMHLLNVYIAMSILLNFCETLHSG